MCDPMLVRHPPIRRPLPTCDATCRLVKLHRGRLAPCVKNESSDKSQSGRERLVSSFVVPLHLPPSNNCLGAFALHVDVRTSFDESVHCSAPPPTPCPGGLRPVGCCSRRSHYTTAPATGHRARPPINVPNTCSSCNHEEHEAHQITKRLMPSFSWVTLKWISNPIFTTGNLM